jgi:transcriptional regulator GlxA family with amidase domain
MEKVAVLVADGFTDSGLGVVLDVLRTANALAGAAFEIQVASATGGPVRTAAGLVIASTAKAKRAVAEASVVIVPGLWAVNAEEMDAALERKDVRALVSAIAAARSGGALIGGSCGGVFMLAEAGVLRRKRATTTWWLAPHFRRRYPDVLLDERAALVVEKRNVVTAGAVFGIADLALHVVARFLGPSLAHRCSGLLLLDRHPSQAPYMAVHQLAANDRLVRRAEEWVRAHMADGFDIAALAKSAGTSPRTLARKLMAAVGQSPLGFVQRVRIETAVFLLRTTRLNLDQISRKVGYTDANTLRRLIRREIRTSPRHLRAAL